MSATATETPGTVTAEDAVTEPQTGDVTATEEATATEGTTEQPAASDAVTEAPAPVKEETAAQKQKRAPKGFPVRPARVSFAPTEIGPGMTAVILTRVGNIPDHALNTRHIMVFRGLPVRTAAPTKENPERKLWVLGAGTEAFGEDGLVLRSVITLHSGNKTSRDNFGDWRPDGFVFFDPEKPGQPAVKLSYENVRKVRRNSEGNLVLGEKWAVEPDKRTFLFDEDEVAGPRLGLVSKVELDGIRAGQAAARKVIEDAARQAAAEKAQAEAEAAAAAAADAEGEVTDLTAAAEDSTLQQALKDSLAEQGVDAEALLSEGNTEDEGDQTADGEDVIDAEFDDDDDQDGDDLGDDDEDYDDDLDPADDDDADDEDADEDDDAEDTVDETVDNATDAPPAPAPTPAAMPQRPQHGGQPRNRNRQRAGNRS